MFSPIFCTRASRASDKSPWIKAAISSVFAANAASVTNDANAKKPSSRAAKSVSELTSTNTPKDLSSATLATTTPSAAVRPAFLAALRPLDLRKSSIA